jgi:hypothetical protein
MPLQTETLAILNELERPAGSQPQRQAVLDQYVRDVAAAHRGVYPDDDETTTTRPWLVTIGGSDANPSVFTGPDSSTVSIADTTNVPTIAKGGQTVAIAAKTTRGAVRRLLTALGVTYTGTQAPA